MNEEVPYIFGLTGGTMVSAYVMLNYLTCIGVLTGPTCMTH